MSPKTASLKCPHCGYEKNRANSRFCLGCGKALPTQRDAAKTHKIAPPPESRTHKLPEGGVMPMEPTGFAFLPTGARVNQRYEIQQTFDPTPQSSHYTYLVTDEQDQQPRILWEDSDAERFTNEGRVFERKLNHPALLTIFDKFEEVQYEDLKRGYLVTEYPIQQATGLGPLAESEVLRWAIHLAEGLAYLHDHQLAHGGIQAESVIVSNNVAKLWNFANLTQLTLQLQAQDVYQLALTLYQLAKPPGKSSPTLSSMSAQVFQSALAMRYPNARMFAADLHKAYDTLRRPDSVNFVVGRMTDVGMKRDLNEDSLVTLEAAQFIQQGSQNIGLYAVADGMGGAAAGEIASRMVTEALAAQISEGHLFAPPYERNPEEYKAILKTAAERSNKAIFDKRTADRTDMGSTLVAALLVGNQAYLANVGDSRAYLISRESIKKITKDHSLVQALVDQGQITEADVRTHPQRNYILRNVGDKAQIGVDLYQQMLEPGQSILLCSDGLWEMMQDEDIRRIVNQNPNPQEACRELIQLANQNGGDDNITCILVRLERGQRTAG
jgi:serine/threonine protein phosphatase PrpC